VNGKTHKTYYAGESTIVGVLINVSHDDGATWLGATTALLSGAASLNGVAVDPNNSERAVAATGGATGDNVFITSGAATNWTQLVSSSPHLPTGAVRNVAFDPTNSNIIYVAHQVGLFKGTISGTNVSWTTFDEGLPNGVDVHDVAVDSKTGTLTIGTFGYGAYTRNIHDTGTCAGTRLIVRDNVFDQGQNPSPSGVADPEHPIPECQFTGTLNGSNLTLTNCAAGEQLGFFKADDTSGGKVYFWDSTDIRIDVPSEHATDPDHQISQADNVEFESCPVEKGSNVESCPPDTMVDTSPIRNTSANAYVQVENTGLQPSSAVRVITMFTDATVQVPDLPSDFWTMTFPAGSTACGALNSSSPWKLVGCDVIQGGVGPDYPQVMQFANWTVPQSAADHSCMLTMVESVEDPIPANIRGNLKTESIAQADRHIAQRNLHVISAKKTQGLVLPIGSFNGLTSVVVPNHTTSATTRTVLLSRSGMGNGRLSFLLPTGMAKNVSGLPAACGTTGSPPAGSKAVRIALPKGVSEQGVGVGASGTLLVGNNSIVKAPGGAWGAVVNAGGLLTNLDENAQVGTVVSVGPVTLESGSTVNGTVETAASSISVQLGAKITGPTQTSASLTPADSLSWQVQIPGTLGTGVHVFPSQTQSIAPGNYGLVSVDIGGTLKLSGGMYVVDTFNISVGATVSVDTSQAPTVVYVKTGWADWGTVAEPTGGGSRLLVVYLSLLPTGIAGPFSGTFVAPSTTLTVGPLGTGVATGSFFGQNLTILDGQTVVAVPFVGFVNLGACDALSSDEVAAATQLGLDPTTVYPVGGNEQQVVLPVAPGGQITLGLRYESGTGPKDTSARFRAISLESGTVLGGSTFVVRRP
jgi:hypothetical protein